MFQKGPEDPSLRDSEKQVDDLSDIPLAKQHKLKLKPHANLKLLAYLLKLELKLKLKPKQPLMLPLLPSPKGFSFSSLAWMHSLPRCMLLPNLM